MLHLAGEQVGDGFEAAVGMVGEAGVVAGAVVNRAHVVEKQEGIDDIQLLVRERTADLDASSFQGAKAGEGLLDGSCFRIGFGHSLIPHLS